MQGLFFDAEPDPVRIVLRFLVVLLGFWTAWRTGKAVAESWEGYGRIVVYTLLLAFVMRFLHHALFNGAMLDAPLYLIDFVVLLAFAVVGFRLRRTDQMTNNYYWLYDRTSSLSWKKKD
jgi:predicted permease